MLYVPLQRVIVKPALDVFLIAEGFEIKEYSYHFRFHPVFQGIFQILY